MTDLNDFTKFESIIQNQFQGVYKTRYKNLKDWSSMQVLIVISTIDEHYDLLLTHEEIKAADSLQELHQILLKKSV